MVRKTSHALLSCSNNSRDPCEQFEDGLHVICTEQPAGGVDLAYGELHRQLAGLMLDDEQKLVVRIGQRRLGAEQFGEPQVVRQMTSVSGNRSRHPRSRSCHPVPRMILGTIPQAIRTTETRRSRGRFNFGKADIERRKAEAHHIGRAKVTDDAARDQRLHRRIAFRKAE